MSFEGKAEPPAGLDQGKVTHGWYGGGVWRARSLTAPGPRSRLGTFQEEKSKDAPANREGVGGRDDGVDIET